MVIAIFGESCTGKSTLADMLAEKLGAKIYTGKDYLRLAKNENEAKAEFEKLLESSITGEHVIYVIAERELLSLIPDKALRVLATAELDTIKARFAARMNGQLPPPVAQMLERKHGCFDNEPHSIAFRGDQDDSAEICQKIAAML